MQEPESEGLKVIRLFSSFLINCSCGEKKWEGKPMDGGGKKLTVLTNSGPWDGNEAGSRRRAPTIGNKPSTLNPLYDTRPEGDGKSACFAKKGLEEGKKGRKGRHSVGVKDKNEGFF